MAFLDLDIYDTPVVHARCRVNGLLNSVIFGSENYHFALGCGALCCWYLFKFVKRTRGSGNGIEPRCKPTLTSMLSCWGFGRMFLGVVNLGLEFPDCFDGMVVVESGLP